MVDTIRTVCVTMFPRRFPRNFSQITQTLIMTHFFYIYFKIFQSIKKTKEICCLSCFYPSVILLSLQPNMTFDSILKDCLHSSNYVWTTSTSGTTLVVCFRMQYITYRTNRGTTSFKTVVRPPAIPKSVVAM
jgi:hypothetical protein